jgi:hypothetical protein
MLPSDGGDGLFLSPIPVPPGDPAALSHAAGTYASAQGQINRDRTALASAACQASGTSWQGTGAAGYISATNDLVATYALTSAALAKGATTLRAYAADLAGAQATARQANAAIATSNAAATKLLAAQATADQSQAAATDAARTSTTADATAAASPHSPSAKVTANQAKTAATSAQSTADADQGRVNTLSAAYEADHSRALTLCTQAQEQATQAGTKAAASFNAASTGLMGKTPTPVRGGAQGVPGGSAETEWQKIIDVTAGWNDKAGWGLNSWGAFGAVVMTKAEVVYLETQADLGKAIGTFDDAVDAVMADKGFFSSGYYPAVDGLNGAFVARRAANAGLLDAIRPAGSDWGALGVLGKAGLGLGMASDAVTMIHPSPSFGPDGLLGGNTDRGIAAANFAASGLALGSTMDIGLASAAMAIPGVDVVVGAVLVGTAAYFAGEFVYQHWGAISHGVEHAASWAGHEANSLVDDAGHDLKKAFSWL